MEEKKMKEQIRELEEQMEALIIAVPKEEAAYHFYLDLAQGAQHEGTRKMFLKLANQELDHKHNLEIILEEIRQELAKLKTRKHKM
jgi:rubrerythrin